MITYTLKVQDIIQETKDTITLCFKQPALRKIKYKAGQYLTLIFRVNGRRYLRPYSFSSAPLTDSTLNITVKRVVNGVVSNHIHDFISKGDSIEVIEPMGDFIHNNSVNKIFLWGVGSGITPLISIIKQCLKENPFCKVNLIYGNRNHEQTIFLNEIANLCALYPQNFSVMHFHTQIKINHDIPRLIEGRIDKTKALYALEELGCSYDTLHYICGPSGLKESVKNALSLFNISEEKIFTEDFELLKDPKDFINIHTQNIKLRFLGNEYDLEVIKGQSILESALNSGMELPYSCQTGNCSTCKATLISGEAKMIGLNKKREDLAVNEYLLCCTYPLADNIYIEL